MSERLEDEDLGGDIVFVDNVLADGLREGIAHDFHDGNRNIVWENIARDDATIRSRQMFGFAIIGVICFFYTLPVSHE